MSSRCGAMKAWAIAPYKYGADDHDGLGASAIVWTKAEGGKFVSAD